MSDSLVVCEVDEGLKEKLKKFRFRKETNNAAIISKCQNWLAYPRSMKDKAKDVQIKPMESTLCQATDENNVKIDKDKQLVILEEEYEDISLDDLKNELPERQPRFIVYSYKYVHEDGRVSYPLCFIFCSPVGCKPEQQMMYAGSKNRLVQAAELTKVFETRNAEDLTEEWLKAKLAFFR